MLHLQITTIGSILTASRNRLYAFALMSIIKTSNFAIPEHRMDAAILASCNAVTGEKIEKKKKKKKKEKKYNE